MRSDRSWSDILNIENPLPWAVSQIEGPTFLHLICCHKKNCGIPLPQREHTCTYTNEVNKHNAAIAVASSGLGQCPQQRRHTFVT